MEKIMVKITASIKNDHGEEDVIEFTTEGHIEESNGELIIKYRESEFSGMPGSHTTINLTSDKMTMKREGIASSIMVFEKGKRYENDYTTPYGIFKVELLTKEFENGLDEIGKGIVYVNYDMSISGMTESNNKLEIEVF